MILGGYFGIFRGFGGSLIDEIPPPKSIDSDINCLFHSGLLCMLTKYWRLRLLGIHHCLLLPDCCRQKVRL